jgi:protein-disulfide isomerase
MSRTGSILRGFGARGALLAAAGASVLLAACSTEAQQAPGPAPSDIVVVIGQTSIPLSEVDAKALKQSAGDFGDVSLSQALYDARRAAIDEIVASRLIEQEAKALGTTADALTEREVRAKITPVSDEEVAAWYRANPKRVEGAKLEQVREPIRSLLAQERAQVAFLSYVERLKVKTPVSIRLEPPRQVVAAADAPSQGPAGAPVEIVEFSDFQCPFCLRAYPTVKQVLRTYGDQVRFVYRHYPLPSHPNARPAAEASQCADDQGQFWAYHDRLFADQGKLSDEDLRRVAADLGLDTARFNTCFESRKHSDRVEADIRAGNDAGITGTPAFFVNGRLVAGAVPFEMLKRVIDEELQAKR